MKLRGTRATYIAGFGLSVLLTLVAYTLVSQHVAGAHQAFSHGFLWAAVSGLAITQLVVQLVLFLHLGQEPKPRWNVTAFGFAALVVVILVFGSIWIMKNLDYNMMPPATLDKSIMEDEGIGH